MANKIVREQIKAVEDNTCCGGGCCAQISVSKEETEEGTFFEVNVKDPEKAKAIEEILQNLKRLFKD